MANGRFITKDIAADKRVSELSSDTARLTFTWLIPFADCEGRTNGDPSMVKAMLFPRRKDITPDDIERVLIELAAIGLIVWYEAKDDLWIWFPGFSKNQSGLRKDREAPSKIPPPTEEGVEAVRIRSGLDRDQLPVKLIEVKLTEGITPDETFSPELTLYHEVTGLYPDIAKIDEVERNIRSLQERKLLPREELKKLMAAKYAEWRAARTADGRLYSPSNPKWIEWCISGYSPTPAAPSGSGRKNRPLPEGV